MFESKLQKIAGILGVNSKYWPIICDPYELHQVSRPTSIEEVRLLDLIAKLRKANKKAWTSGCGLAAIQIGVPVRFAWFLFNKKEFKLLNPEIIEKRIPIIHRGEGCLSIPEVRMDVLRYNEIVYVSDGKTRKAKGLKAFIIQHEIDHMDGVLITDKQKEVKDEN